MILFGPRKIMFCKLVCVWGGVCVCAHEMGVQWHWGSSPKEGGKGEQENFETERRKKKGGNGGFSSAFCH